MFENEDEEDLEGLYENGHWEWNDESNEISFEKDFSIPEEEFILPTAAFGPVEFRDDLDLIEQQRFRKRFQRKSEGDDDVICLQDVKDFVLYTTPSSILTPTVVNILHLSTTDRFLRALIFYCQYYLQTADDMSGRMLELETKLRTKRSAEIELELRENIEDLRILVAKEYITMIIGGADYRKYHHMGLHKKLKSLSKKDAQIFESILRIAIQIVWLALGRRSLNQIEVEVHRMFKSQIFNIIEHKLKTNYLANMLPFERYVLVGDCLRQGGKLTTQSPLMNGILCHRPIDFRLFGLGTTKFPLYTPRLRYMELVLSTDESTFHDHGISLGILGLLRSRFDTMLKLIAAPTNASTSSSSSGRSVSKASRSSMRKSVIEQKLYGLIQLPSREFEKEWLPKEFPTETMPIRRPNPRQRKKWLARASQLAAKHVAAVRRSVTSHK